MRKTLLATTALIAVGGVSAANADVSISGGYEASWVSSNISGGASTDTISGENMDFQISFSSTLDNGMSITGQVNTSEAGVEETGATISGDFGTIGLGPLGASDGGMSTAVDVTPDEGTQFTAATDFTALPADENIDDVAINYTSPSMGGFKFAVGRGDAGTTETTVYGASFTTAAAGGSVTIKYANMDTDSATATASVSASSIGVVMAVGDATITVAQNTQDTGETVTEALVGTGAGVTYKVSDSLALSAYTASGDDDKSTAYEFTDTGVGLSYTITPGMVLHVTHNEQDLKNSSTYTTSTSSSRTSVNLNLSF